jgi:hypothetical protein
MVSIAMGDALGLYTAQEVTIAKSRDESIAKHVTLIMGWIHTGREQNLRFSVAYTITTASSRSIRPVVPVEAFQL